MHQKYKIFTYLKEHLRCRGWVVSTPVSHLGFSALEFRTETRPVMITLDFRGFPQSLQANVLMGLWKWLQDTGVMLWWGHMFHDATKRPKAWHILRTLLLILSHLISYTKPNNWKRTRTHTQQRGIQLTTGRTTRSVVPNNPQKKPHLFASPSF